MNHILKTDPDVFDAVASGVKRFEIRKDDRGYQVGDTLELRKTRHTGAEMAAGAPLEYVGAPLFFGVTHILRGPIYGLQDGWVIMSIDVQPQQAPETYSVDAVAWETFVREYDRYSQGDPKYPFSLIREGMAAVIHSAQPQKAKPLSDSHPLAVFAQECALGAHDYGGLRLAAQNALKAAGGIKGHG